VVIGEATMHMPGRLQLTELTQPEGRPVHFRLSNDSSIYLKDKSSVASICPVSLQSVDINNVPQVR
jgi:hypothetical protein